nr:B158 [uncultured bacterium]ART41071.1 L560 [uncultured bacterium]
MTLGWDAKCAGFASVLSGRWLNLLGFLRHPNLHASDRSKTFFF